MEKNYFKNCGTKSPIKGRMWFLLVLMSFTGYSQMYISGTTDKDVFYIGPKYALAVLGDLTTTSKGMLSSDGELLIGGNLTNNGSVDFKPATTSAVLRFNGDKDQKVLGANGIIVNNLQINTNSLEVSNGVTVNGEADFVKGVVKYNGNKGKMVFGSISTTKGGSNQSYVEGEVEKSGKNAFKFPLGAGGFYNYASILESKEDKKFSFKYELKDSNSIAPHDKKSSSIEVIDNKQYWILNNYGSTKDAYFLTVKFNEETVSESLKNVPKESLVIIGWDTATNKWLDLGGTFDSTSSEILSSEKFPSTCTVFAIATATKTSSLTVYNALSPNNDDVNDCLKITGIEKFQNTVKVINRWGKEVYSKDNYTNGEDSFCGINQKTKEVLTDGTYYYIIEYIDKSNTKQSFTGYLYISR